MKVIGIIPARMAASRFPHKPMALIHGLPMVGHCYHRTKLAVGLSDTYVATCDHQISEFINSIGGKTIMTSNKHTRATTRTAEAIEIIERLSGELVDIVVMVQGDEPLILPDVISNVLPPFSDPEVQVVNVMSRFASKETFIDHNNVKVVVDSLGDALYFSREPIPSPWKGIDGIPMFMQTGIIAFRREALLKFNSMPESALEKIESIDMNRILESGGKIRMILTDSITIGVDTPVELDLASNLMKDDSVMNLYHQPQSI
jgi:3-deoxy-manno-octulosonate cytidylyltransferase (CMP-KDO synthetase)